MPTEKHYVRFHSPGTLVDEVSEVELKSLDCAPAVEASERIVERYGAKPYGFIFVTRLVADPIPDGRGGTMNVEPKEIAKSAMHFLGGEFRSRNEVLAGTDPQEEILRFNIAGTDWLGVVDNRNSFRTVRPFQKGDRIVDASGQVVRSG